MFQKSRTHFEVDLDDPLGVTTLFSINNAPPKPALGHLIFWTDWSAPSIDFDVYLTGYDVVTVNLREVFGGYIPITADAPNDPDQSATTCGSKSPCGGSFSQHRDWDDTDPNVAGEQGFDGCDQLFPFFVNPLVRGNARDRLVQGHTGQMVRYSAAVSAPITVTTWLAATSRSTTSASAA